MQAHAGINGGGLFIAGRVESSPRPILIPISLLIWLWSPKYREIRWRAALGLMPLLYWHLG